MITILILAVLISIALVAALYDLVHDGYGRVRTDFTRVSGRDESPVRSRRGLHTAH